MAQNTLRAKLLTMRPYEHKDSEGKKTGKQKGWVISVLAENSDLGTMVDTLFPTTETIPADFLTKNAFKPFDTVELTLEAVGINSKPRLVGIAAVK
jgi:hypothetical protein